MAKKSMIAREAKRTQLVAKYAAKRAELKQIINNVSSVMTRSGKRRSSCRSFRATLALCASVVAARSPGAHMAFIESLGCAGINCVEAAMRGDVPGLVKSSW